MDQNDDDDTGKGTVDHLFSYLRKQINELRNEHCDFTIIVGDTKFRVHKFILMIWSDYFRALFRHESLQLKSDEIQLDNLNKEAVMHIINYCYELKLNLDNDNIQDILIASSMLQIKMIQDQCIYYIKSKVDRTNCFGVLAMANGCNLNDLFESTLQYCLDNFLDLLDEDEYYQLDSSYLKQIISNQMLNADNELNVAEAILKWSSKNCDTNQQTLDDILSQVRFTLIKPKDLVNLSCNKQIGNLPNCLRLINYAKDFHLLNDNDTRRDIILKDMNIETQQRSTLRLRQRIYAIGGWSENKPTARMEKYNPYDDTWVEVGPMSIPRCALGTAVLNDNIYAIGGHDGNNNLKSVERYNIKTGKWYNDVADMSCNRSSLAAITLNGFIYAIGGQSNRSIWLDIVEKYNPITNSWSNCAPLQVKRLAPGVAVLNGFIYVIGGANDSTLDSVERYDPKCDQWIFVKPMNSPRKHFGCTSHNNLIYVFGGRFDQQHVESGEYYDPITDQWTFLDEISMKWSGFGLVVLDSLIYAVGGLDVKHEPHHSKWVRVYDPERKNWTRRKDLICRRLGGGLVLDSRVKNNNND